MTRSFVGLGCGLVVALAFGWFAYRLGQQGHDWLAGVIGGADLGSLVAIFVLGVRGLRTEGVDERDE